MDYCAKNIKNCYNGSCAAEHTSPVTGVLSSQISRVVVTLRKNFQHAALKRRDTCRRDDIPLKLKID